MLDLKKLISGFARDERGASLVEYTVLIGLITVAVIVTIGLVGTRVGALWDLLKTNIGA